MLIQPAGQRTGLAGAVSALLPVTLGIAAVILMVLPFRLFEGLIPMPIFPLAIIFYWSLVDRQYLPPLAVFFIGLFQDLLSGGAFGIWAFIYLMAQYLTVGQRDYFLGRDWHVVWTGFSIICLITAILLWGLASLLAGQWAGLGPVLGSYFITALVFPLLQFFFSYLDKCISPE